jgi:hypothetical protein
MIEDMTVRGFSEQTRSHYIRHVRSFAAFIGRSTSPEHPVLDVAPLLSQRLRNLMRHRGRFLNQDVERSSGDQFATVSANLPSTTPANASPAQPAAQSNPHRRPTTHQPPRVLSSEFFGRRPRHGPDTAVQVDDRPASETLHGLSRSDEIGLPVAIG